VQEVLLGLVILLLGLGVCFFGLQAWFVMLPIWGGIAGFFVGATGVAALFGGGFLGNALGFLAGLVVALVFAVLSYFFWYVGAILAAGSVGALIGTGLMEAIGLTANWWLWIVGLVVGVLFALAALLLNLPVYIVLVNSAFAGAAAAVTGLLLVLDQVNFADLGNGPAWATLRLEWFWAVLWIVVGVVGMVYQLRLLDRVRLPEQKWAPAQA
jgi:hypothetical protein